LARRNVVEDPELGRLTDDRLTRDIRVWQRERGHRFSSDDVATAYVAHHVRPEARRILDLGCGLGSVLLQLAWKQPQAQLCGVEAQEQSFALLTRNVARSGYGGRLRVEHGDLRSESLMSTFGSDFDLVTGTPPYFPAETALIAEDEQRAYARLEYRGGIEAYIDAGSRRLSADGSFVLCGDARALHRTTSACERAGLHIRARCDVLPRSGKSPLFSVWTLGWSKQSCHVSQLTLRSETGAPAADAARLREFGGFC
jgi:tRNA1(Val) A37 N6-methylase TrmN6